MRLARGSGAAGLAAPGRSTPSSPSAGRGAKVHVRPLLALGKREIAKALRAAGAPWREDSSNAKGSHFRNRLRKSVVRGWVRASERDALAGAALSRELLEEDDRALEAWVDVTGCLGEDGSLWASQLAGQAQGRPSKGAPPLAPGPGEGRGSSRQGFDLAPALGRAGFPCKAQPWQAWLCGDPGGVSGSRRYAKLRRLIDL